MARGECSREGVPEWPESGRDDSSDFLVGELHRTDQKPCTAPLSTAKRVGHAELTNKAIHQDSKEDTMKAEVGDRIVVASGTLHRPDRDGEILQTGEAGAGPYLVRWSDSSESLFFPGPDAHVEHVRGETTGGTDQPAQEPPAGG
jgi:hypothetical protein